MPGGTGGKFDRALVLGSGIAGLVVGRILADHFERVVILDRDVLPEEPEHRKGVPQGPHTHLLPANAFDILVELFPDIERDLEEARAPSFDWAEDFVIYAGKIAPRSASGLRSRLCTRKLLEWTIRRRVFKIPNVEVIPEQRVTGLLTDASGERITGVTASKTAGDENKFEASLVIDATGRTSKSPKWLETLGYPAPRVDLIDTRVGAASQVFEPPPNVETDWVALLVRPTADNPRQCALTRIEHGLWRVTLVGINAHYPANDAEGFMEFARQIPYRDIHEKLADAKPVSKVVSYRHCANQWVHYEAMRPFPDRYVILGDAFFHANPIYTQGMALACKAGVTLRAALEKSVADSSSPLDGLGLRIHEELAKDYARFWLWNISAELAWLDDDAVKTPLLHRVRPYFQRIRQQAMDDAELQRFSWRVTHGILPLEAVFAPDRIASVADGDADTLVPKDLRALADPSGLSLLSEELLT